MVSRPYGLPVFPLNDAVRRQIRYFQELPGLTLTLDALPHVVVILNCDRQMVYANRYLLDVLQLDNFDSLYGRPPGELLDCPHAFEDGGGCGFTEACQACGANRTISFCRRGERSVQECRILQRGSGRAVDVRVAGTPVCFENEQFTILALTDISDEKRRQALERIFFHDLLNIATGISAFSAVLNRSSRPEVAAEATQSINRLVHQLAEEIRSQRELIAAESNQLELDLQPVNSRQTGQRVLDNFRGQEIAAGRELCIAPDFSECEFVSDRVLVTRVLANMVKNALEAISPGQQVMMGCAKRGNRVEFRVHNPGEMPREVKLQVFQRSFSTKGRGRGLGTYSVKLLTEGYLRGHAWFTSTATEGTTFYVSYPL